MNISLSGTRQNIYEYLKSEADKNGSISVGMRYNDWIDFLANEFETDFDDMHSHIEVLSSIGQISIFAVDDGTYEGVIDYVQIHRPSHP